MRGVDKRYHSLDKCVQGLTRPIQGCRQQRNFIFWLLLIWGFKYARLSQHGSSLEYLFQQLTRAGEFEERFTIIMYLRTSYVCISEESKYTGRDDMAPGSKVRGNVETRIPAQAYTCEILGNGDSQNLSLSERASIVSSSIEQARLMEAVTCLIALWIGGKQLLHKIEKQQYRGSDSYSLTQIQKCSPFGRYLGLLFISEKGYFSLNHAINQRCHKGSTPVQQMPHYILFVLELNELLQVFLLYQIEIIPISGNIQMMSHSFIFQKIPCLTLLLWVGQFIVFDQVIGIQERK